MKTNICLNGMMGLIVEDVLGQDIRIDSFEAAIWCLITTDSYEELCRHAEIEF